VLYLHHIQKKRGVQSSARAEGVEEQELKELKRWKWKEMKESKKKLRSST
jgi:hypothetical protein